MKALILDDEPLTAKLLKKLIESNCYGIKEIVVKNNPVHVLSEPSFDFDILFLDIKMPQMTAFEFLKAAEIPRSIPIIFTTAHEEFALEAFNANAIDYLVKPVSPAKLISAVNKAKQYIGVKKEDASPMGLMDKIKVYHDQEYVLLNQEEIVRIEADGNYCKIVLKGKAYTSSKKMLKVEEGLNQDVFFRCHKSHLINLNQVRKIGKSKGTYIVMSNEDIVPVSSTKKSELESKLGL